MPECDVLWSGQAVSPVLGPSAHIGIFQEGIFYGPDLVVPSVRATSIPLRGKYFLPVVLMPDAPLVVILHGAGSGTIQDVNDPDFVFAAGVLPTGGNDSAFGYRYLGETLARQGFHVYSLDLTDDSTLVNLAPEQRSDFLLAALDMLITTTPGPAGPGLYDGSRVALIGHSLGGGAAVLAEDKSFSWMWTAGVRPDIRAVVSLAGVSHDADIYAVQSARFLALLGSADYFITLLGPDPELFPFEHYDHAPAPKTLAFLLGANHYDFNSVWLGSPSLVDEENIRRVARDLVVSLMRTTLLDDLAYEGWLEQRSLLPRSSSGMRVDLAHEVEAAREDVVDLFDNQDPFVSTVGTGVTAVGTEVELEEEGAELLPTPGQDPLPTEHDPLTVEVVAVRWTGFDGAITWPVQMDVDPTSSVVTTILQRQATFAGRDLVVEVSDGVDTARVRLGAGGTLGDLPYHRVEQVVVSEDFNTRLGAALQSLGLPLDAFLAANPRLSVSDLASISLRTDTSMADLFRYLWPTGLQAHYTDSSNSIIRIPESDRIWLDRIVVERP